MVFPERKHSRLKDYDYSQSGCYHLTICTRLHQPILASVIPAAAPTERASICLSKYGHTTDSYIRNIPNVYQGVFLDHYCIMPNHVHLLLSLAPGTSTSIPTIIRSLKRMINRDVGQSIWQASFLMLSSEMKQCTNVNGNTLIIILINGWKTICIQNKAAGSRRLEGKPPYSGCP